MCGVIGYIGKPIDPEKHEILKSMLLESVPRGRDGWGYLAYRPGQGAYCFKDSVAADQADLDDKLDTLNATAVLMHVRAATSGSKEPVDCHPLAVGQIAVVHNGMVYDHTEVRKNLGIPKDAPQVDSYLIPWIIAQKPTIMEGIQEVFTKLSGSLTFLVFTTKSPLTIWAASNVGTNLYHFRMGGGDYLASSKDIFRDAISITDKWGTSYPAFKESFHLKGVYEFSPYRISLMADEKQVQTWEDAGRKTRVYKPIITRFPPGPGVVNTGEPAQESLMNKIRVMRNLLTDSSISKKKRKHLMKRYHSMMVEARGFGADTEFTKLGKAEPPRECSVCHLPAYAVYQDLDLCEGCLKSFLAH